MEELMTEDELCKWLRISTVTAYRWRKEGMPFIKVNRAVRYDRNKVQEWLEKRSQSNN